MVSFSNSYLQYSPIHLMEIYASIVRLSFMVAFPFNLKWPHKAGFIVYLHYLYAIMLYYYSGVAFKNVNKFLEKVDLIIVFRLNRQFMEQWIQVLSTSWLRESFLGLCIPGFNWELRANSCSTDIPILIERKLESLLIT